MFPKTTQPFTSIAFPKNSPIENWKRSWKRKRIVYLKNCSWMFRRR